MRTSRRWISARGLSPRVRGNPLNRKILDVVDRSIPACAGEPPWAMAISPSTKVYPRVCGGTPNPPGLIFCVDGLSPRVRGNRLPDRRERFLNRARRGLSPRVRGNHRCAGKHSARQGSIPACAGEPDFQGLENEDAEVYPRVCGGTSSFRFSALIFIGLSPRVRGNLDDAAGSPRRLRSIPACAGEPAAGTCLPAGWPVYPRVCGGTGPSFSPPPASCGLSPRVRGNPVPEEVQDRLSRSIPACAGESTTACSVRSSPRVYPRVCGGTIPTASANIFSHGLSPRVRGNRTHCGPAVGDPGSIPACAGEPPCLLRRSAAR